MEREPGEDDGDFDNELFDEAVLCKDCWKKLYCLRAVTFPVQGVHEGGVWKDFCAAVRQSLEKSQEKLHEKLHGVRS